MFDIIGTLYEPGTYDAEGEELTPPVALPGWHVNSPSPVEGWEQYQVEPSAPRRVFAGHPTFFYVFADEEEFTSLAIESGLLPAPEPEPASQE